MDMHVCYAGTTTGAENPRGSTHSQESIEKENHEKNVKRFVNSFFFLYKEHV